MWLGLPDPHMTGDGHWPTFQGNEARTGWQRGESAPLPPVDCAWTYETVGRFGSGIGELSPVAAAGTVYLHTSSGRIAALDAATGDERWRRDEPSSFGAGHSTPTLEDGTLFVGIEDALHALDPTTGETKWTAGTAETVTSSPVVADGTVFVQGGGVAAFDAATGEERWHVDIPTATRSSTAVADGTVYVGSEAARLHALDAATGAERWAFELVADTVTDGGVAPVTADDGEDPLGGTDTNDDGAEDPGPDEIELDGEDLGLDIDDEETEFEAGDGDTSVEGDLSVGPDGAASTPAVAGGTVFCGGLDGTVYAVDAATGTGTWRVDVGETVHGSPAVADGLVFVGSSGFDDNHVYALDAATGERRWVVGETMSDIRGSPAVVDGTVFVGYGGDLYALHTGTGQPIWSVTLRGTSVSSVAVSGGRLFVESNDQYLYALESGSETVTAAEEAEKVTADKD